MGMPRTILISTLEKPDNARILDTRINAHTSPRSVATTSAHANTSTVTSAPFARIGRYSARSLREITGGSRIVVYRAAATQRHWIPAFAGMTEWRFRGG